MIDIHCHILPGIDDGPSDMDESVRMCRVAEKDGIRTIVATPHHKPGAYETPSDKVYELIDSLQRSVDA
ncbi:MAG: hypothetical protein HY883_04555 [Deltaproteobacteria bacterium]|nr:hypothetical protein [Deltaproteobacteria bacterium]